MILSLTGREADLVRFLLARYAAGLLVDVDAKLRCNKIIAKLDKASARSVASRKAGD